VTNQGSHAGHPLYEAAHRAGIEAALEPPEPKLRTGTKPGEKRSFNEAAHKLGYWRPENPRAREAESEAVRKRFDALKDSQRDVITDAGKAALALGALGVVYGDIGTSPLYTEQVIFTQNAAVARATAGDVYGVVSLIFWALIVVVGIKYAGFIMRAHNRGDGGIMALAALIQRHKVAYRTALVTLGLFGAALFFGDAIITPAISVLGSVQGLKVVEPELAHLVVPISVVILIGLFVLQRHGSGTIGFLFGPVILVWFAAIALLGMHQLVKDPAVLQGLSPTWGVRFLVDHGLQSFFVLGGVVLAVTGAETLYADRGHFGAAPIRIGWFAIAFPALVLNYLGQAAMIRHDPSTAVNPFFLMSPGWARIPMLFLATAATIIASQAAISGSFSVARQAVQLGFLPRLNILHPSKLEGQIYVPIVNWALCIGVVTLALIFQSADRLGDIYGVAVTATFVLNTLLFLAVARFLWGTPRRRLVPIAGLFLTVEVAFFASNIIKIEHGAWLSLALALVISVVMINWRRGQTIVSRRRIEREGSLSRFLADLESLEEPPTKVPGVAVHLHPTKETTPLALRLEVESTHTFPKRVLVVSVDLVGIPNVEDFERFTVERIGGDFNVLHVTVRAGYHDALDLPAALRLCRKQGLLERNLDLEHASYFISRISIKPSEDVPPLTRMRKKLFVVMARNAASPIDAFQLPSERTVLVGSQIGL
jgi:KUP system potassium uptake protein